jgi:hypothetical protein
VHIQTISHLAVESVTSCGGAPLRNPQLSTTESKSVINTYLRGNNGHQVNTHALGGTAAFFNKSLSSLLFAGGNLKDRCEFSADECLEVAN